VNLIACSLSRHDKRRKCFAPFFALPIPESALKTKRNAVTHVRRIAMLCLQFLERQAMDEPIRNPPPVWERIHPAARRLGLSPDLMVSAARTGQLPIRIEQFGRGKHLFANTSDLANYINRLHPAQGVSA
jgi:hypothetical protein